LLDHEKGATLKVAWDGKCLEGEVGEVDIDADVMLIAMAASYTESLASTSSDVRPGDELYSWVATPRNPEGESLTVRSEGWSRAPYLLKLKEGQILPGMSGGPLYSLRVRAVVGMVRRTRDAAQALGGRAVPITTVHEVARAAGILEFAHQTRASVSSEDLPWPLSIFDAAYASTRPIAPVDRSVLSADADEWPELAEMQRALAEIEASEVSREKAVRAWHGRWPECVRFITADPEGNARRIGATCVLPLSMHAYHDFRGGRVAEFDISADDLAGREDKEINWLCFQSFALATEGGASAHKALREAIVSHVLAMSRGPRLPRVIAEIGTKAGLEEVKYFGMKWCGLSAAKRPLFEIDMETDSSWRKETDAA
jgi:hypothetical protein